MDKQNFSHLHVHYDASFIDGLGTVDSKVEHAKSLGFDALGITEHGNLTNTLTFISSCKQHGVKPVIGMEGYVNVSGKRFHITLLADGNTGFKTLVELNNLGVQKYDGRPTFDIGDFKEHNKDLIVLTGCPESPMQIPDDYESSKENFVYLSKIFKERLYAELMLVNYNQPYDRAIQLSQDFGVTLITTNDVHFAKKEQAPLHQRLVKMKSNFSYNSEELYLTTYQELLDRTLSYNRPDLIPYVKHGMQNAYKLAHKLKTPEFTSTPKLPHIPNSDKKLWDLIENGYEDKVNRGIIIDSSTYRDRYKHEYDVIKSMDFSTYFLILHDVVNYAHKQNIWVGTGRGSGAGSLILFLIGITGVDPIKYGLYFERFLNHKRAEMPDVDLDFESERRQEVIDYSVDKWDAKPISTYSTYNYKSAIMDISKGFDISKKESDELRNYDEKDNPKFKEISNKFPEFEPMYNTIEGQIRHLGQHAGGVVISESDFPIPLVRTSKGGNVIAWTEGKNRELSDVGLVKDDFLGLSSGSVIQRLRNKYPEFKMPEAIDNHEVFGLFRDAKTDGVFQFGTSINKDLLRKVQPDSFGDLVAINALCRTGVPQDFKEAYADYKKSGKPRKLHPEIDNFLVETWGGIVFQEQFMQIIGHVLDGDMTDADLARKVLSKKDKEKLPKLKKQFFDAAQQKGWKEKDIKKVWNEISLHSGYSFNKSHSVAYSLIAWEMACWKFYYPVDFYTELLNVENEKQEKVEEYLRVAVLGGIDVKYPNINKSTDEFTCDENAIYLPLTVVKYVSHKSYHKIANLRPFKSITDYMERVPKSAIKKRGREGFLALGVYDDIIKESNPEILLDVEDTRNLPIGKRENKYLGFKLPTHKYLKAIKYANNHDMVCGTVKDIDERNGKYGKYKLYKLSPDGIFLVPEYQYGKYPIEEGMTVIFKTKQNGIKIEEALFVE